ncbi:MAG: hypothetical protein HYY67_08185 [Thaumarchaeota archaeon]|nr:hypothetical protein [Nitrososphaerota archaeon]
MKSNRTKNFSEAITKLTENIFIIAVLIATTLLPMANTPLAQAARPSWFPNYCAIEVPSGTAILSEYSYRTPNGTTFNWSPARCPGHIVDRAPTINDWLADGIHTLGAGEGNTYRTITSNWTSPSSSPSNQGNQGVFFFDGLIRSDGVWLMQPVLGWGCARNTTGACQVGGQYWWISAILDNTNTHVFYWSTAITSSTNRNIQGKIFYADPLDDCSITDAGFKIIAKENSISSSTTLIWCDTSNYTYGYAGVLEGKGVDSCNQLPNAVNINYTSIAATTDNGASITSWTGEWYSWTPDCGPHASYNSGTGKLTLRWHT